MTKISRLIEIFRFIRQIYLVYTPQQDFGFLSATNRRRIRRRINRDCLTERAKLRKHRLEKNMYRMLPASLLLVAFTAASSAQDLSPSVWQSQSGAILKVLNADPATGNLTGVFISSPTGQCPAVPYDLAGHVQGPRVVFQTSRTWTADCSVTTVWSGLHQPDDRCNKMGCNERRARWSRDKDTRYRGFPAHLNRTDRPSLRA